MNTRCRRAHACLLLLVLPTALSAEPSARTESLVRAWIEEGQTRNFAGDYDGANEVWQRIREHDPTHPAAAVSEIDTIWWRLSLDDRDTRLDNGIRVRADQAITLGEERLERDPDDAEAHLYMGQAMVHMGRLLGTRGQLLKAGSIAERGREHLERALELDPKLVDARLFVGMYYFYASIAPELLRWLSWLWFVPSGDRETGLRYIREVYEKGDLHRDSAAFVLLNIHTYHEVDLPKALAIVRDFGKRFPDNSFFDFELVEVLFEAARYDDAIREARKLEQRTARDRFDEGRSRMATVWRARSELYRGWPGRAWKILEPFEDGPRWPSWGSAWVRLARAQVLDLCSDRKRAVEAYEQVAAMEPPESSRRATRLAEKGLEAPFSLSLAQISAPGEAANAQCEGAPGS